MHHHQFSCPWDYLSEFFHCPFKEWSGASYMKDCRGVNSFDEISAAKLDFEKFFRSFEVLVLFSYFFFHLFLFDEVCFRCSHVLVIFLLSKRSDTFLFWQLYFFYCFSFPFIINQEQIPFLYPGCIFVFYHIENVFFLETTYTLTKIMLYRKKIKFHEML